MESLRKAWSKSKAFRAMLILAIIWFIIRLAFQLIYAADLFPELTGSSGLPEDLPVYMGAAQAFDLRLHSRYTCRIFTHLRVYAHPQLAQRRHCPSYLFATLCHAFGRAVVAAGSVCGRTRHANRRADGVPYLYAMDDDLPTLKT